MLSRVAKLSNAASYTCIHRGLMLTPTLIIMLQNLKWMEVVDGVNQRSEWNVMPAMPSKAVEGLGTI